MLRVKEATTALGFVQGHIFRSDAIGMPEKHVDGSARGMLDTDMLYRLSHMWGRSSKVEMVFLLQNSYSSNSLIGQEEFSS